MTHDDFKKEAHVELATLLYNEMTVDAPPANFGTVMAGVAAGHPVAASIFMAFITVARNLLEDEDYELKVSDLINDLQVSIAEDKADRIRD